MRRQAFNADSAYISHPYTKSLSPPTFSVSGLSARLPYTHLEEHKQTSGTVVQTHAAPVRTSDILRFRTWAAGDISSHDCHKNMQCHFYCFIVYTEKKIPVKNGPFI